MEAYSFEELGLRVFLDRPAPADSLADVIHHHSFCELHILLENRCVLQTDRRTVTVEQGQFCLVAPNVSHATQTPSHSFRRLILSVEELRRPAALGRFLSRRMAQEPLIVGEAPLLPLLARRLDGGMGEFSREYNRSLLSLMLVELARAMGAPQASVTSAASSDEARSMVMDDFFNRHFMENGTEEALASALGLSRRQLDRVMHSRYGMSFREKMSRIRLEVACDLLRRTRLSVQEVAERVGYAAATNFTVFFRKQMGQTPTQYRKSLQL